MRKILMLIILPVLAWSVVGPSICMAKPNINELTSKVATQSGYDAADQYSLSKQVGGLIKSALSLVGTIFLALVVYAGFLWMTASGNEDRVTKATGIIKMATIGLIIVVSAYSITGFVLQSITVRSDSGTAGGGSSCDSLKNWNGVTANSDNTSLDTKPSDSPLTASLKGFACFWVSLTDFGGSTK